MHNKETRVNRILVVEAEEEIRKFLSTFLSMAGYEVTCARSGEEGLDLFVNGSFNLVLSDLTMSSMDGWALARHIKDKSPNTPVGLMTGWGEEEITTMMKESAVDFALFKPFGSGQLQEAVATMVQAAPR